MTTPRPTGRTFATPPAGPRGAPALLRAVETGCLAADRLAARPVRRVLAAFSRTLYLDGWICLAAPEVPCGPLVARLRAAPRLPVGAWARVDPGPVWRPPACRRLDVPALRSALALTLAAADPAAWLAAWPSRRLAGAFAAALAGLPASAPRLLGLGPGLTPAGDDALAGYALAGARVGRPLPALDLERTTALSAALLGCALAGLPGEDEARLLAEPSPAAAARVAAHGATSGLATLAGMWAAVGGGGPPGPGLPAPFADPHGDARL